MAKHYHIETPLKLDGKRLPVGQTVPLDDARAEELLAMGAITPAATPAPKPPPEPARNHPPQRANSPRPRPCSRRAPKPATVPFPDTSLTPCLMPPGRP